MDDLNQVAATLAAALYTGAKTASAAGTPKMAAYQGGGSSPRRIAELFWAVRQELVETKPRQEPHDC